MKKIVCVALVVLLMSVSVLPVGAYSPNDNNFNGIELSARRFSANLIGKSNKALAEELLTDLGVSEKIIALIPDEKIDEIVESRSMGYISDYCKIVDGKEFSISKEEFEAGEAKSEQNTEIQLLSPGDSESEMLTDELLEKTLFYCETKNSTPGTFSVYTAYNFINYALRYHGEDVLAQSGEHLIFNRDSFNLIVQYTYFEKQGTDTVEKGETEFYDVAYYDSDKKEQNRLLQEGYAIAVRYNLKNVLFNMSDVKYTTASFLMMTTAIVDEPKHTLNFNIYGSYFHQKVGLGSVGIDVEIDNANVSVTPSLIYDEHQINSRNHITYNPY